MQRKEEPQAYREDPLGDTRSMIRVGNSARFTPHEVDELRRVGLDMSNVTHQIDIDNEWVGVAHALADERFNLLEKIVTEMAKVRSVTASQTQRRVSRN